ncbi:DUF397 domain-containing protein [Streptomyces sp. NBC_01764]|uniref:DUF397 domain-containing protein n=1 Tax=Streptomyces sp. NBC_01764 TaxID=2975935 RepID=UPI00224E751D|nr:DUF397 domain-containing protein [Streptomyces sp. NBC_01764]MCX4400460.1 DUF397 domain-containing protein [Streptomyces sp. NBC_01764]
MTALSTPQWFKYSYRGGSGTECVKRARSGGGTRLRDSKGSHGPLIAELFQRDQ